MKRSKPIASLSLDLDNHWSYLKTHGDAGWESFPSYLDVVVPRILSFLKERNLTITVFIVGQDAALEKNREMLSALAAAGHEIGNHSFQHEPWLHLYSEQEIETELANAEEQIERATGRRPLGFRSPGFSLSPATLRVLARRGYLYDASTCPTFIAPLARVYYFMTAAFTREQRRQRGLMGGRLLDVFRPLRPYQWCTDSRTIIEIPVTTIPVFRLPLHVSYLQCLRVFSSSLALRYFDAGLTMCQWTGTYPSLLLHPTDFLGCDDTRDLSFVPGMSLPRERKIEFVSNVLGELAGRFNVMTVAEHARKALQSCNLPLVDLDLIRRKSGSPFKNGYPS